MNKRKISLIAVWMLFAGLSLFAQSGGTINMSTNAVTSGGERSSNGNLLLESTLGQPVAGSRSFAGNVEFYGGFWSIYAIASGGAVEISPSSVIVNSNSVQLFTVSGGFAPYTFSISTNISGSSINPTTGEYTAGPNGGIDIIRVVDAKGNFAEATATVMAADVPCPGGQKLWDGGGFTNNWSESANWCGNELPNMSSQVRFSGASSKNAFVDINANINYLTIESGYGGAVLIGSGITLAAAAGLTQNDGIISVGSGTLNLLGTFSTLNGGSLDAGSGTVNVNFFLTIAGGTFTGGSLTLIIPVVNVTGGSFVSSTGVMTVALNIQRSGGSVDLDNGTIEFTGPQNGAVGGTNGPFKNLTINKSDDVGVSFTGTNVVNGTLKLSDGLINSGTLEARGSVTFLSSFGQTSTAGEGVVAFRPAVAPRTVDVPAGVSLPDIIVDDANLMIRAIGAGTVSTDSITLNAGTIDLGSTDLRFGYNVGVQGSAYLQTGGSFSASSGNIVWNTFGNFTLTNGTFNGGSGTVHLGGNVFSLSGGTFTPSTGSNTFTFNVNNAFEQTGGVFASGAGSIDINGRFTLSGGTFNASAGNTNFGFVFNHTAGAFNNNNGTVIFDSPHPAYSINVPGNPGTGVFHNLVMNPSTPNTNIELGSDAYEVAGYLHILNGQYSTGNQPGTGRSGFVARGDVVIGADADGGNVAMYFEGGAVQTLTSNGAPAVTGSWTVQKNAGSVLLNGSLTIPAATPLNIDTGEFRLGAGSDLTTGSILINIGGKLTGFDASSLTIGGGIVNNGRIDLRGGGSSCPSADTLLIRSTTNGVVRHWSGSGIFRIVDADVQDMGGTAAITAYSSTDRGNELNWTFDAGCPAQLGISPQSTNVPAGGTLNFEGSGGYAPYTFSLLVNNSGGSISSATGAYTAGSVSGVADTIRVTDAFGATADAVVNVVFKTVVTNTNDSGPGSLRQAIIDASAVPGQQQNVTFDIPGNGPHTILLSSQLPIAGRLNIDGRTQPGYAGVPLIEVRPAVSGQYGLIITGTSTLQALSINGFDVPLQLENCLVCSVQGNYIGVRINGTTRSAGLNAMKVVASSSSTIIGGTLPEHRNLIANMEISHSEGLNVRGNYFGLDAAGNDLVGESIWGIRIIASGNVKIGSSLPGAGNVISGFSQAGILIAPQLDSDPPPIYIRGNKIGTDSSGSIPVPNAIGLLSSRPNVIVGGTAVGEGNLIAFNGTGVQVFGTKNSIRGNSIHSNSGLGIDLSPNGVSANDFCDLDSGGNLGQNFPVIDSVTESAGSTTISGYLATGSPVTQNYTIDFYFSPSPDATGFGEGQTFIGSITLTIPSTCTANSYSATFPVVIPAGYAVSATATDSAGNTSEFSQYFGLNASIGGRLLDGVSGQPVSGIIARLSDLTVPGPERISSTDSSGKFDFSNLPQGHDYLVRLGKKGFDVIPNSRTYQNLSSNQFDDYTTALKPSIRGVVTMLTNPMYLPSSREYKINKILPPPQPVPAPVRNVLINVTDSNGVVVASDITDNKGEFYVPDLNVETYTITASKTNFTFTPPSITLTLNSHAAVSFSAQSPGLNALVGRFIYENGAGLINSINANGTGAVTLINRNAGLGQYEKTFVNFAPSISKDGTRLAFASSRVINEVALRTGNDDQSNVLTMLSEVGGSSFGESSWSPGGTRIAYVRGRSVRVINSDGTGDQAVCYKCSKPDWSPDGSRLLVIWDTRIATVNPDGSNLVPFQFTDGATIARWSGDGGKIAFAFDDGTNNTQSIETMNADGTNRQTVISVTSNRPKFIGVDWSPDDNWIGYTIDNTVPGHSGNVSLNVISVDGSTGYNLDDDFDGSGIEWGIVPQQVTPAGTDVRVGNGAVTVTFPTVTDAGFTSIAPISPQGTGSGSFDLDSVAFEINSTATFLPSPTVCVRLDPLKYPSAGRFDLLRFLHMENGVLVDRTVSRNFATRTICAQVDSFSPFQIAELIDSNLPTISGVVIDSNGLPMRDVPVYLSGSSFDETTTDGEGNFRFVNLDPGSNYVIEARRIGYLFDRPYESFLNLQQSAGILFTASAGDFSIAGNLNRGDGTPLSGVKIKILGGRTAETETDIDGNYAFQDLPANGAYRISPVEDLPGMTPLEYLFDELGSDQLFTDFTQFAPTAANASASGRVATLNGTGLSNVFVSISGGRLEQSVSKRTNSFGYFRFDDLPVGETYFLTVQSSRYIIDQPTRVINLYEDVTDVNFIGNDR